MGLARGLWRVLYRLFIKRVGQAKPSNKTGFNKRSERGTRGERGSPRDHEDEEQDEREEIELKVRY